MIDIFKNSLLKIIILAYMGYVPIGNFFLCVEKVNYGVRKFFILLCQLEC